MTKPLPAPGPAWPLRYELRRAGGVRTGWLTAAAALAVSLLLSVWLVATGSATGGRLLAGWPPSLPLPPAALAAGLLGALAFGQEYRYPALAHAHGTVPRRLGTVGAKLLVTGAAAAVLAPLTVAVDGGALLLLFGEEVVSPPARWPLELARWTGLAVGCAWTGLLAAGLFRSTSLGLAAVLAVPVLVLPALQGAPQGPSASWPPVLSGLPERFDSLPLLPWPAWGERWAAATLELLSPPLAQVLALSLAALLCGCVVAVVCGRGR